MKFPAKYWIPSAAIAALTVTEGILRLAIGLGNPVLVQADADTGYRFQPNQKVFRFGRTVEYNQYSQRSEPITRQKPQGKLRVLMTGDSVLNGGNPTDQHQTITELFETKLSVSGYPTEVLNASAGSWGIGNQLGYLSKFGTLGSDAIILQIGTHDLTQPTSTSEVVGQNHNYPNQRPLFAIQEAWTRYALPKLSVQFRFSSSSAEIPIPSPTEIDQQFQQNMTSLKAIVAQVRAEKVLVFVLFTPNRADLLPNPQTPKYKLEFLQVLDSLQVPVIDSHEIWSTLSKTTVETYFRDGVHLSVSGNQAIAGLLFEQLCITPRLPTCSEPARMVSAW